MLAPNDIHNLAAPVAGDEPCGGDLEYDPVMASLLQAVQGREEQQFGDTFVPAEPPDWRTVLALAQDLLTRSKDLRVLVHLAVAQAHLSGWQGFAAALSLLRQLLQAHWGDIHPRLDPEDANDPTLRVNTIESLAALPPAPLIPALRGAPLAQARTVGTFSLRDLAIAAGELPPDGDEPASRNVILAAFDQTDEGWLADLRSSLGNAREDIQAIGQIFLEQGGNAAAVDLSPLDKELARAQAALEEFAGQKATQEATGDSLAQAAQTASANPSSHSASSGAAASPGVIHSREDVVKTIEKCIDYYQRHEPSSPVPLLLDRAKRLVPKSFIEIVSDLAPNGMEQVETFRGRRQEAQPSEEEPVIPE
ncbi:MAG: type VI secretion system protein TssA [Pseudomonadota bacterium]